MALDDFVPTYDAYAGHVRVSGERWNARSQVAIAARSQVRVNGMDGLTLLVEPGNDEPAERTD
jgi:membrane-bound serine protease (ClpP class)